MLQFFYSLYNRAMKNRSISVVSALFPIMNPLKQASSFPVKRTARSVDKPALALAQTQRRGPRACLQAWEGACRRTRALFHV